MIQGNPALRGTDRGTNDVPPLASAAGFRPFIVGVGGSCRADSSTEVLAHVNAIGTQVVELARMRRAWTLAQQQMPAN